MMSAFIVVGMSEAMLGVVEMDKQMDGIVSRSYRMTKEAKQAYADAVRSS